MSQKLVVVLLITFILSSLHQNVFGQKCKTSQLRQERIEQNPAIVNEINRINQFTEQWIHQANHSTQSRMIETLPVVVHVIWETAEENISDAQIQSQIDILNTDFRRMNADFANTPTAFQGLGADIEIEFCLASIDPFGNPTTGITRTETDVAAIGEGDDWYQTANGGKDSWDVDRYINIWVCNLGEDDVLAFATTPGTAEPPESDGIVMDYRYMGTIGTAANSQPNHLGRTGTHEMGHYLNLEHLWGPEDGGCGEDDFVTDTPAQEIENYDCSSFPLLDNCTDSGNGVMFMNYMDYSDDDCMTMFSEGQKMRMLAALNGPRAGLLNSNACGNMTNVEDLSFENNWYVYPNPSADILTINISENKTNEEINFKLVDVLGKQHLDFTMQNQKTIDVSQLNAGIYYLYSQDSNIGKKIIISK